MIFKLNSNRFLGQKHQSFISHFLHSLHIIKKDLTKDWRPQRHFFLHCKCLFLVFSSPHKEENEEYEDDEHEYENEWENSDEENDEVRIS